MRSFSITSNDADQRLDAFMKKLFPNAPLSAIYRMNRVGKIKVNGKKRPEATRLQEGETVHIFLHDDAFEAFQKKEFVPEKIGARTPLPFSILYEDDDLFIVNKHAGINVHAGDHKTLERSLIDTVQDFLGKHFQSLTFKPSLVHRIDRDTSGALIIAKTKRALIGMLDLLQHGKIEKIYHAIVLGVPNPKRGTLRKKLFRLENAHHEAKVQVDEARGQTAITHYRVLREFGHYSLVECRLETGRTHQIRVHLASLGTPILGDGLYGVRSENAFAKRSYALSHQMLHAYSLAFCHPITGKELTILAPYPEDFSAFLRTMDRGDVRETTSSQKE